MKKVELETAIDALKDLKLISDRLNYNESVAINTKLMLALPVLEKELTRLEAEKIDIACPQLIVLGVKDVNTKQTLSDFVNEKLKELVLADYKIIDYGLYSNNTSDVYVFIKYTS